MKWPLGARVGREASERAGRSEVRRSGQERLASRSGQEAFIGVAPAQTLAFASLDSPPGRDPDRPSFQEVCQRKGVGQLNGRKGRIALTRP